MKPAKFGDDFLTGLLHLDEVSPTYVVERAHRVPMGKKTPGVPPSAFLVRYLNYRDHDHILSKGRKHPSLPYDNTTVHLYADFTAEIQKKRRSFTEIQWKLCGKNIPYSMLYLSRLRVPHGVLFGSSRLQRLQMTDWPRCINRGREQRI